MLLPAYIFKLLHVQGLGFEGREVANTVLPQVPVFAMATCKQVVLF